LVERRLIEKFLEKFWRNGLFFPRESDIFYTHLKEDIFCDIEFGFGRKGENNLFMHQKGNEKIFEIRIPNIISFSAFQLMEIDSIRKTCE
jgi:hypothetical protein